MHTVPDTPALDIPLDRKVAFLRQPKSFPGRVALVRAIETHMSWVFLADGFAYKLKKPVRLAYLDYASVEARRRNCMEEVRLNRKLAPGVYLAALPITRERDGELALDGEGAVVDWLVKMRRLPDGGLLDALIARRAVTEERIQALAALLARFYADAPRVDWAPGVYVQRLRASVEEIAAELLVPEHGLPNERVQMILRALRDFLGLAGVRFERRVRAGRVVEGHGDLRPEHVCLDPGPVVIDCLEFNREFRLLDPLDELAYLALECERLGAAALGTHILELYAAESGDRPDQGLVAFHKSHRACLRAELAVWHLRDAAAHEMPKWRERSLAYLALAAAHCVGLQ